MALVPFVNSSAEDEITPQKAIYYAFDEAFTINFLNQSKQQVRYLQIKVSLMAHQREAINNASANLPMLQDALRTLFSEQGFNDVNSVEGRRTLQSTALSTINTILKNELASDPVEAVYFTSFILQ
jgi:flagellar FliL protein